MCEGVPLQPVSVEGIVGQALEATRPRRWTCRLSAMPGRATGCRAFSGAAHPILPEDEALTIRAATHGLADLMRGDGLGGVFADLEARAPALPPIFWPRRRPAAPQGDPIRDNLAPSPTGTSAPTRCSPG